MSLGLGEVTRTITVEPVGRVVIPPGPDTTIIGSPPMGLKSWWPLVVAVIAIGGLWYLTRDERDHRRPLGGGG